MPPHLREELDAYAAGVNAYIEAHGDALPLEFRLLRYAPRPWEPQDTVAVGKLLAMDLAQGWDGEAFRATVGDRLPPDVQEMLFPTLFAQDRILFGHDEPPPRTRGRPPPSKATCPSAATTGWSPGPAPRAAFPSSPTTRTSAWAFPRSGPRSTSPPPASTSRA